MKNYIYCYICFSKYIDPKQKSKKYMSGEKIFKNYFKGYN